MRPSHIRVFDGLRVTTEHMNHLQGSFQSSMQEIRQVLGLERVHYGLDVIEDSKGSVMVRPGLAFDRNQNRVVLDELKILDLKFPEGQNSQYVCARYVQTEGGVVEGHPTMIWDDCEIVILTNLPDRKEGLICLARIEKGRDRSSQLIIQDLRTPYGGPDAHYSTAAIEDAKSREGKASSDASISPAEPRKRTPRLCWNQGVTKCRSMNDGGGDLQSLILESIRTRLLMGNSDNMKHFLVELGTFDVAFPSKTDSVDCEGLVSIEISSIAKKGVLRLSPDLNGSESTNQHWLAQSDSHGEISLSDGRLFQHGLSQVQYRTSGNVWLRPWPPSRIDDGMLCILPFSIFEGTSEAEEQSPLLTLLRCLNIQMSASVGEEARLKIVCHLSWQGGVTKEHLSVLEGDSIGFKWDAVLAWKSVVQTEE